ncbi:helix-turn-helix transcriptional regulator [Jiangella alkaliphila]|uniref:Helix-turn-helix domain-containing protein n=1 Tax=Jiangella alkaliphila TaxID=419479 RepID=A0A1H2JDV1_9ACTN|nr:helix-turn-helix transcriptional regulator [Jiangella alkaliphila]SDU54547.1 Helix-turn-helix domain-containing protein [Jiangella alkaliphila]
MRARTVRDLGAVAREARRRRGMTQAELAQVVGISRDWVVRLERGHPRLEAQLVLDALAAAGVAVEVSDADGGPTADDDPFGQVLGGLVEGPDHG